MPITGLPSFSAGILTAAQLNAIVTALETKFAGQIVTGDISWPMTAGGNINMAQYQLINVSKFWNAYNAAERAAGATLQSIIDLVSADGGGIVLIPGNTSEAVPLGGISVPANVYLVGDGKSSVLQMHASANAAMVTFGVSAHNAGLINLRLAGNTAVNQIFVDLNSNDFARLHGCFWDTHGTSPFIKVRAAAVGTSIQFNNFVGNGDTQVQDMILLEACTDTRIFCNNFEEWTNSAVKALPVSTAVSNTVVASNKLTRSTTTNAVMTATGALNFNNSGAVASSGVLIVDNSISGGGAGVHGVYCDDFDDVIVSGNAVTANVTEPAMLFRSCARLSIVGNKVFNTLGDAVVIGADNGTEAAATADICNGFLVAANVLRASAAAENDGAALILVCGASPIDGVVSGNVMRTANCNVIQVWAVTAAEISLNISGNACWSQNGAKKGFASYSDMGTTNDGNIGGTAADYWFTMVGNTIPNSTSGTDWTLDATNDHSVVVNNNL